MYLPSFLRVLSTRSLIIGTHPPQPVPAFVHFFIASTVSAPSNTCSQILPLLMPSQLHIVASSGKLKTPAPAAPPFSLPPRERKITSSGCGGKTTLFFVVCKSILYSSASPTRMPPSKYFPSFETLI